MKKIFSVLFYLWLGLTLGCTFRSCEKEMDSEAILKIGTNANFPPYESMNDQGELIGFDIEVGKALAKRMKRKPEFKEFDFDALILALNKGQIDIILSGMSITESRQKEIAMVPYQGEPLTAISFLFWQEIPKNLTSFDEIKELANKEKLSVSVQSGHYLEEFLRSVDIPVKPLAGPPEQVLDIKYGKSLAVAVDSAVGKKLSEDHPGLKNVVLPLPKDKWDLGNGIGIKKSRTAFIEEVSTAVTSLKEDGTLKNLSDTWLKGY